jgi:hypothetical protein
MWAHNLASFPDESPFRTPFTGFWARFISNDNPASHIGVWGVHPMPQQIKTVNSHDSGAGNAGGKDFAIA